MCVPLAPAPADTPWRWPREVSGQLEHCSPACAMQLSQLAILISCRFRGFYYYFIAGYYNDTLFHRSIKNFMIQVGWLSLQSLFDQIEPHGRRSASHPALMAVETDPPQHVCLLCAGRRPHGHGPRRRERIWGEVQGGLVDSWAQVLWARVCLGGISTRKNAKCMFSILPLRRTSWTAG